MRVLILGGTGFLGPQIAERLAASGHEIAIFHRGPAGAGSGGRFPEVHGDRNKLDESSEDLRRVRADIVVDLIAFTERQAESLVDVFRGHAGRLVVLSSGDVYRANDILFRRIEGTIDPTPLAESAPLRERLNPYRGMPIPERYGFSWDDYDKIPVERTVMRETGLPATVLRLPMVFGPGVHDAAQRRFFPYLKRMDDRRGAILLDQRTARWRAPWGFSGDVAEAVRLAVENDSAKGEIYNVGDSVGSTQKAGSGTSELRPVGKEKLSRRMGHVQPQVFRFNSTSNNTSIWIRPRFGAIWDTGKQCHAAQHSKGP